MLHRVSSKKISISNCPTLFAKLGPKQSLFFQPVIFNTVFPFPSQSHWNQWLLWSTPKPLVECTSPLVDGREVGPLGVAGHTMSPQISKMLQRSRLYELVHKTSQQAKSELKCRMHIKYSVMGNLWGEGESHDVKIVHMPQRCLVPTPPPPTHTHTHSHHHHTAPSNFTFAETFQ